MLLFIFLLQCVKQQFTVFISLLLQKIRRTVLVSYKLVTFNSNWYIHHNWIRHTHKLSFLVPPSILGEHIYGAFVILRKCIFQISPGWLLLLLLFWFKYLYHRYSGQAISHSLKEAIEDRRKRGKKQDKYVTTAICSGHCVWRIVFINTVFTGKHAFPILVLL